MSTYLAGRLGVGERQLRRLFRQHLGASPVAVAQTRRVLLAKQLIHETRLPMTEIAFAAGFGSIRRFNETFRRCSAVRRGELRRATAGPDVSAAAHGEIGLLLRYQPPYDWAAHAGVPAPRAPFPASSRSACSLYARSRCSSMACTGTVTVAAGRRQRAARDDAFPKLSALPIIIARLRRVFDLGGRSAGHRRASCKGSGAGAAGERAAGLARARRLGRLRTGDPRRAWPADHCGRGCAACRPHGRGAMASRCRQPGERSDARFSTAGGHCRRRSRFARHAAKPGRRAVGGRSGGCCRSASVRRQLRARRRREKAARHPRCR